MMSTKELREHTSKLRLLYVEDDKEVSENMLLLLKNFFTNIDIAKDGHDGLELYKNHLYDIVLTDVYMPKISGLEMAKEMRSINQNQIIIFLTANNNTRLLMESIKLGVDGFIIKPLSIEQIQSVFSKAVEKIQIQQCTIDKKELDNIIKIRTKELEASKKELQMQKDELEAIFLTSKDGIAIVDLQTNFLDFNDSYLKMTGFTSEELLTKSCLGLSAEEDKKKSLEVIQHVIEKGECENFEKACYVKDGKKIIVNMSMALMPNKKQFVVSTRDITKIKKSEKKLKDYMELIDENIVTSSTDLNGIITHVSQAFCDLCEYTEDELIGSTHSIVRAPDMKDSVYKSMWDSIIDNKTWSGEIKNISKSGHIFWMSVSVFPIFDNDNKKVGYTSIRHNITDKKHIEKLSITDGLTSVFNRRHFNNIFPKFINMAKRKNDLVCFLMIDIDYFKDYNDTYGHQKGDDALIDIAKCIKKSLKRADDYLFRLGGEEFCIIFKAENKNYAIDFANNIRNNVENLHIPHSKNTASKYVTISLGLACKEALEIDSENSMYKESDKLLYKAKSNGRNTLCVN